MNKKIIYLIQGQADLIEKYFYLRERSDINVIFLTYDREIKDALYRPNTSWGEGRNILLEEAEKLPWDYCVFCDDDFDFVKGSHEIFEDELLSYCPAIAVPVFMPKTENTVFGVGGGYGTGFFIPFFRYQVCRFADAQVMAFHRDVIKDCLVVPLQTQFDSVSWYYTSSTQQLLMFSLYENKILQFNRVAVQNLAHREYQKCPFDQLQAEWLKKQFVHIIRDRRYVNCNLLSIEGLKKCRELVSRRPDEVDVKRFIREFITGIYFTIKYKPQPEYLVKEDVLKDTLRPDSELLLQHLDSKKL